MDILDSLPNELLIMIAGLCEHEDLSNVSLVSRRLWQPFQRELFRHICIRLGNASLFACKQGAARLECLVKNERILSYILRFELSNNAPCTTPDLTIMFTTALNALPSMSALAHLCFRYITFNTNMIDRLSELAHKQTIHLELRGCDYPTTYSFPHRLRVSSLLLVQIQEQSLPFLRELISASRWYINSLSTKDSSNYHVFPHPFFPLPTSAPLQRLIKLDLRTVTIQDADIILFLNRNPTIEQLHLPLQRGLFPQPADALPRLRQLWGSLDAICNLVPGRPVSEVVITHTVVNLFSLSVYGALDALKRSAASIRLAALYQMIEGLSLEELGTFYARMVEAMPYLENLRVGGALEVRRVHLECPYPFSLLFRIYRCL